jgi:putative phage-type endonuclease
MIKRNMTQNTEAWLSYRSRGLGSSEAAAILGVSPYLTRYQLWEQKLGIAPPFEGNYATERGHRLEPIARAQVELELGIEFSPLLAEHLNYPFLRASLDGYSSELDAVLEIKCPGKEDHALAMSGKVPEKYWPQVQFQLFVTNAKKVIYYSFDGEKGCIVEALPDLAFIGNMVKECLSFWELIQTKTPPELSDRDIVEVSDDDMLELANEFERLELESKQLEARLLEVRKKLIEKSTHARTKVGKVMVTRSVRAGSVDYSKVPELKSADLSLYRKPDIVLHSVRIVKEKV